MAKGISSKTIVWIGLAADVVIAAVKIAAALFSGSAAMAAEGVHSTVDVVSGGLMLYGFWRSEQGADPNHPFGYGGELYFWSFVVALLFLALGAGFSNYEGGQRIVNPSAIRSPLLIYAVLGAELLLDGTSWFFALRSFRAAKGGLGYWQARKDPPGFMVLAEDSANLVGISVAAGGTFIASSLCVEPADGGASIFVSLILVAIGWVLVRECKGLLIGEAAGKELASSIVALSESQAGIEGANGVVATQLAPNQVVAAVSLEFDDELQTPRSRWPCRRWRREFARSIRKSSPCSSSLRAGEGSGTPPRRTVAQSPSPAAKKERTADDGQAANNALAQLALPVVNRCATLLQARGRQNRRRRDWERTSLCSSR